MPAGERRDEELVHVLKYRDVLALLHCHRRTLEYYIEKGYLTRVYGNAPKKALALSISKGRSAAGRS